MKRQYTPVGIDLNEYQKSIEAKHSKRHIKSVVLDSLMQCEAIRAKMSEATELVENWLQGDYYDSKNQRLAELANRDIDRIVQDIIVITSQVSEEELFTSVVGKVTSALNMSNKIDGTKTAAELLAVISDVELYDIFKDDKYDPLKLISNIELDSHVLEFIDQTQFLPPMVVPPKNVRKNYDFSYLTQKSSMITGKGICHDGDICLDSINKFNQVPLSLNVELLTTLSEQPKKEYTDQKVRNQWHTFVTDSYRVYKDLIQVGNEFWLTHKYDSRGRTYAQGYHVTTQGNKFRKAIVELAEQEVIE
ncbi:hypothetical protein [Marisediminitalea sp.]|uniref:hypothetical protein n=1 Tax=Marisediminitalea sp. TaxID=2662268 RepID=UPI003513A4BB